MKKQKEHKNVDIQYSYSCTRQLQLSYILLRLNNVLDDFSLSTS